MYALNHCISAYACFAQTAQHEDVKGVLALLFVMVFVVTTFILHLRVDQNEHDEQVQGSTLVPKPRDVAIDIPNIVSLPAPLSTKGHRPSNNSQDTISPNPTIEGDQNSYGVPSQSAAQTPPPIPGPGTETQEPDLKIEWKVATWVTIISAGGIVSVISGVIGNEKALLPRKILFKGFISLNYIAFVSGIGLLILIKISPNIPGFVRIVKFMMWIAIGSLVYSLGLATCIVFPAKPAIVLFLIVPLVMVGLVGFLSFARRE